jgi:hypothetical protein
MHSHQLFLTSKTRRASVVADDEETVILDVGDHFETGLQYPLDLVHAGGCRAAPRRFRLGTGHVDARPSANPLIKLKRVILRLGHHVPGGRHRISDRRHISLCQIWGVNFIGSRETDQLVHHVRGS